ncbi:hypothetical protein [Nocardioides pelophilus]|nr:hypothetical protein [Nocardioides pelophilus]
MSVMGSEPRVRDLAREAVALMAFSAGVSIAVALVVVLAYGLGS